MEKPQNTLEDCLAHVPLLIKPPAGRAVVPGMRDQLTELIDFTATVFELAEIDPGYLVHVHVRHRAHGPGQPLADPRALTTTGTPIR